MNKQIHHAVGRCAKAILLLLLFLTPSAARAQLSLKPGTAKEVPNDTELLLHRNDPSSLVDITDDNGQVCALLKLSFEYVTKCDREVLATRALWNTTAPPSSPR